MVPENDIEQLNYGYGYKGSNSPQQHMSLKVDGGGLAIALSLVSFGGLLILAIMLPQLLNTKVQAEVAQSTRGIAAQAQSAQDRAWKADQTSVITSEQLKIIEIDLARKGLLQSRVDGH